MMDININIFFIFFANILLTEWKGDSQCKCKSLIPCYITGFFFLSSFCLMCFALFCTVTFLNLKNITMADLRSQRLTGACVCFQCAPILTLSLLAAAVSVSPNSNSATGWRTAGMGQMNPSVVLDSAKPTSISVGKLCWKLRIYSMLL